MLPSSLTTNEKGKRGFKSRQRMQSTERGVLCTRDLGKHHRLPLGTNEGGKRARKELYTKKTVPTVE